MLFSFQRIAVFFVSHHVTVDADDRVSAAVALGESKHASEYQLVSRLASGAFKLIQKTLRCGAMCSLTLTENRSRACLRVGALLICSIFAIFDIVLEPQSVHSAPGVNKLQCLNSVKLLYFEFCQALSPSWGPGIYAGAPLSPV